jgi:hypothetical protein
MTATVIGCAAWVGEPKLLVTCWINHDLRYGDLVEQSNDFNHTRQI